MSGAAGLRAKRDDPCGLDPSDRALVLEEKPMMGLAKHLKNDIVNVVER